MSQNIGRFVWYDIMTKDEPAALAFYGEVLGYGIQTFEGPKPYTMLTVDGRPIGGIMELPPGVEAPPHWLGYVKVEDVDATCARAKELGGVVHHAMDIPDIGRFGVIADPQGAVIALFAESRDQPEPEGPPRQGRIGWHELNTTDHEAAWRFYQELFGWKHTSSFDMGEGMGEYFMFDRADAPAESSTGGMSSVAKAHGFPPHWLYYATVDDIDAAVSRVKNSGGKLLMGPHDIPGGGKIAQCQDPQGGAFALLWMSPS